MSDDESNKRQKGAGESKTIEDVPDEIINEMLPLLDLRTRHYGAPSRRWVSEVTEVRVRPDQIDPVPNGVFRSLSDALIAFTTFRRENPTGLFSIRLPRNRHRFPEVNPHKSNFVDSRSFAGLEQGVNFNGLRIITPEIDVAFENGLYSVIMNPVNTIIFEQAFVNCSHLISVTFPENLRSISWEAFLGCRRLTTLSFPAGLWSIGDAAFYDCSRLNSLTFPTGLKYIGKRAFQNCKRLTSLILPPKLEIIKEGTFIGCRRLNSITFPAGLKKIGVLAFFRCHELTTVTLPAGLTSIGKRAFQNCKRLTSLILPPKLEIIKEGTFIGCRRLNSITFPAGLKKIGVLAFFRCHELTTVTLPAGLTSIGYEAFRDSGLQQVFMSRSTTVGHDAFNDGVEIEYYEAPDGGGGGGGATEISNSLKLRF